MLHIQRLDICWFVKSTNMRSCPSPWHISPSNRKHCRMFNWWVHVPVTQADSFGPLSFFFITWRRWTRNCRRHSCEGLKVKCAATRTHCQKRQILVPDKNTATWYSHLAHLFLQCIGQNLTYIKVTFFYLIILFKNSVQGYSFFSYMAFRRKRKEPWQASGKYHPKCLKSEKFKSKWKKDHAMGNPRLCQ